MSDIKTTVIEVDEPFEQFHAPVLGYAAQFTLEGADNPGIVHKMTSALAAYGLSIDELETEQEIAPFGGSVIFRMRGVASVTAPLPATFDPSQISAQLVELGDSLNCDVKLTTINTASREDKEAA